MKSNPETIKLFENPEYTEQAPEYRIWSDLYEGNQKKLKQPQYLWKHELEYKPAGKKIREIREQRSAYTNWAEVLVSLWTSILMRKDPIIPDDVSNLLGDYIKDVDGENSSLTTFIRDKIVANYLIYGTPIVRVDALGEKPVTLADEANTNYRPFMQIIDPLAFVDWDLEKKDPSRLNKLKFCRIQYCEYAERQSPEDPVTEKIMSKAYVLVNSINEDGSSSRRLIIKRYELVDDSKLGKKEKGWKLIDETEHPDWSEIPIVFSQKGISWLKDVVPHILTYFNTDSVLNNITLMQGHQRIFVIGPADKIEVLQLSESALNSLPEGTTIQVIEPGNLTGVEARLDKIFANIMRMGLNQFKLQIAGQAVEGADTLQQIRDSVVALIQAELENVENVINHAVNYWAEYLGQDDFDSQIKFDIEDVKANIDEIIKLILVFKDDVSRLPKVREKLLNWFINKMDLEDKDELYKEVKDTIASEDIDLKAQINTLLLDQVANGDSQEPKPAK